VSGDQGVNPRVEVPALVAGMVAGANSINNMDLLRRGGMGRLFSGVRAPSTLGIFLRAFTFGHVSLMRSIPGSCPGWPGRRPSWPGAERKVWLDLDDAVIQTYGYAKQAAGRGYTGVKGLNALVAATRLRRCPTSSTTVASQVTSLNQPSSRC